MKSAFHMLLVGIKKMTTDPSRRFNTSFLTEYFTDIKDPRRTSKGNLQHRLSDILLLILVSVLCKCSEWDEMVLFGEQELDWFKTHGEFSKGIPSESTLRRVFVALDPESFQDCFSRWAYALLGKPVNGVIAIDGKTIRGAKEKGDPNSIAPHILSALACEAGICLGQLKTQEKSNEITAIPQLLNSLSIKNCTITIDAIGCQREIVQTIISKSADYVIAAKGNQGGLFQAIKDTVNLEAPDELHIEEDCGHGRIEKRTAKLYKNLSHFEDVEQWAGLKTFIAIEKESYCKKTKKQTYEQRYYISSLNLTAKQANAVVRKHWFIENKLHWSLDVTFGEDYARKRKGHSAENMNMVMKIALALINKETSLKKSKKKKQLKALIDRKYREKLLGF